MKEEDDARRGLAEVTHKVKRALTTADYIVKRALDAPSVTLNKKEKDHEKLPRCPVTGCAGRVKKGHIVCFVCEVRVGKKDEDENKMIALAEKARRRLSALTKR